MPPLLAPCLALLAAFAALGDTAPIGVLVALAAGALAPDVDLLLLLVHPAAALRWHRGPTHTLVGLVATSALGGLSVSAAGGPAPKLAIPLALAGTAVHALCDAISTHGIAAGLARTRRRFSHPLMIPLDPLATGLAVLAALGSALLPSAARILSLVTIAVLGYLVGIRAFGRTRAWSAARTALPTPIEGVYPRPESPLRWTVVTREVEGIAAWVVDVGRRRAEALEPCPDAHGHPAAGSRLGRELLRVSGFPVVRTRGSVTELRDLRFAYDWPSAPFGADVTLDAAGVPVRERAYL